MALTFIPEGEHLIEVPLTEYDLELFKEIVYSGGEAEWICKSHDGETNITIIFTQEGENEEIKYDG